MIFLSNTNNIVFLSIKILNKPYKIGCAQLVKTTAKPMLFTH